MRYKVRHSTHYAYGEAVDLASHMLHLSPRVFAYQAVLSEDVTSRPAPGRITEGRDHFGNRVSWFFLDLPHATFEVTVDSLVDVAFPAPPSAKATPAWEAVAAAAIGGGPGAWEAAEFSFGSPMAPADSTAGDYIASSFTPGRPILEALLELNGRIKREFEFKAGVTTVSTPVARVVLQRAGVCQDFTHVMIAGLRCLGLPARYVSGYIRTHPPVGGQARRGADQSHAWVAAWLGVEHGWVDLDPTNDIVVREEHVVLGWGRDFGDVSPLRGIILGGGRHSLTVSVDLEAV